MVDAVLSRPESFELGCGDGASEAVQRQIRELQRSNASLIKEKIAVQVKLEETQIELNEVIIRFI